VADSGTRRRLQSALRQALRERDTIAVSALRSALAAIDNAGAAPSAPAPAAGTDGPYFAGALAGLGAGEAERLRLSEAEIEEIVRAEVAERHSVARDYDQAGRADQANRLRREAYVLTSALDASAGS
jgi:uncharacterized protein